LTVLLEASRHPLAHRFSRALDAAGVAPRERLLLLVSGGADSMAMMTLAAAVRRREDPRLDSVSVRSFDHGLRAEAALECVAAVELARELGVQDARSLRIEVAREGNILAQAREARLAAAAREACNCGARAVLVAHHADDRAESLLLALGRGLGFESLTALLPSRELLGSEPSPCILVRPLLGMRRRELRALLESLGIRWCEDPSNALRGRGEIRTEPALAALADRIASGAHILFEDAAALHAWRRDEVARRLPAGAVRIARAEMDAAPEALRSAILREIVHRAGSDISRAALEGAMAVLRERSKEPHAFDCEDGRRLVVDAREISCSVRP
jgi:tRNA(Ile)-lysidine synthase